MTGAAEAHIDRTAAGPPAFALLVLLPLLAGCGGARLSEEASAPAAGPPPARLLVVTDGGAAIVEGADPALFYTVGWVQDRSGRVVAAARSVCH